jgi:putative redox protein
MGTVTLRWVDGQFMVGLDSQGHSVAIGRLPGDQTHFSGIKPSDLLLLAAASCSAFDVVEILIKQREPVLDFRVICSGEQKSEPPYTFTHIHLHYMVYGAVKPDKLERAISLAEDKYCSVISTLRPGVPVTSDYEIIEKWERSG